MPSGRGAVNGAGLDFYERLVDALLATGISPWVTLFHWDLPQALEDAGGWPERATAEAFVDYAAAVSRRLGDRVQHWITLNEPWCSAFLGYLTGHHAPGQRDLTAAIRAGHHLLLAHGLAVPVLRENSPHAQIGTTLNFSTVYPASQTEADHAAAQRQDNFANGWFLDPICGRGYPDPLARQVAGMLPSHFEADFSTISAPLDFLGVNYYNPTWVRADPQSSNPLGLVTYTPAGLELTDMGWPVEPQGLEDLLIRLKTDCPYPLAITENGAAEPDPTPANGRVPDPARIRYLAGHLHAVHRAIAQGVDLRGYFAWSLLDNFEWSFGYTKRFGLVYTDYATQQRTIKDSGRWCAQVAATGCIQPLPAAD